jgi:predicted unusual protein kinase regulating ubiquinone biosynthesis (AarF/ABC1/UbiB family)
MLHPTISRAEERRIYSMVQSLMKTVLHMGQKHGLTHNDMHTDNVLYDPAHQCFVLIDYGRMLFDCTTVQNMNIMDIVKQFKRDSWLCNSCNSYGQMVHHLRREGSFGRK